MSILIKLRSFLLPYLVLATIALVLIFSLQKMKLHLLLTENRCLFSDGFFRLWTEFGGNLPYILIALLFFYKYGLALYLSVSQIVGSLFSFVLKRIFALPRPKLYFHEHHADALLPQIQNMHLHYTNSMPSGHTITAFALFFGLALISKNKLVHLLCFLAAALVAYSRVYLSQHFIEDVVAGSALGILSALLCYPFYGKWEKSFGNRSLLNCAFKQKMKLGFQHNYFYRLFKSN